MMRFGSLFTGIGGLDLGMERAGMTCAWMVEQDDYARQVLRRHWPTVPLHRDVREVGAGTLERVDVLVGGFPCQDISSAGKGAGLAGERSGLWFEFARIIGDLRPRWVVIENVASGAKRWVNQVTSGLEQLGYEALPFPLSAEDVGAPHRRARVFVVAYASCARLEGHGSASGNETEESDTGRPRAPRDAGNPNSKRQPTIAIDGEAPGLRGMATDSSPWATLPDIRGVDDGVPTGLDASNRGRLGGERIPFRTERLRCLGNAVVPQCAEVIGWIVRELDHAR